MKVMVETSAHHVHVSEADLETLFGKGAALTNKKDLSQPGQFACEEKVEVVGPKGAMKMSILGPTRPETQVEISLTDARKLGIRRPFASPAIWKALPAARFVVPLGRWPLKRASSPPSVISISTPTRPRRPAWWTSKWFPSRWIITAAA